MDFDTTMEYLIANLENHEVMKAFGEAVEHTLEQNKIAPEELARFVVDVLQHFSDEIYATNAALDMFMTIIGDSVEDITERVKEENEHDDP